MDRSREAGYRDKMHPRTQPNPTSSNFQNLLSSQWETAGDISYLNHNISMCQIYLKLVISHKYANNPLILLFSVSQSLLKLVHRSCGTGWWLQKCHWQQQGGLDSQVWGAHKIPKQPRLGGPTPTGRRLIFTTLVNRKCFEWNPYMDFCWLSLLPEPVKDFWTQLPCAFPRTASHDFYSLLCFKWEKQARLACSDGF